MADREKMKESIRRIKTNSKNKSITSKVIICYLAQRIEMRTKYDIEMLEEVGFTSGIENYSRHLALREAGKHLQH